MADIYDSEKRSQIMSRISGNGTKPELLVRKFLFARGFRFLKNDKRYPGKPDIVLPKYKTMIFVHGCFWHGHDCKAAKLPRTRTEFWNSKINSNKERDKKNMDHLTEMGWKVLIVWQCEFSNTDNRKNRLHSLVQDIIAD